MDSPHFTWLCFLLLTIAAPRPSIATSSDNPAEGTQDSSFGKTNVTVCHCKDCESHICKLSNYEDFVKIGETQTSSANARGNISKTCCKAETDLSVSNPPLKCYTEMSDEKTRKSTADITDEGNLGNPQFSISKKSSIGIIIPVLILGVCAAALAMYCVQQNRNGQGPVIVLHQIFNVNGEK